MKCPSCSIGMKHQNVSVNSSYGRFSILIHDVPAEVCTCGERVYVFETISILNKIAEKYSKRKYPPREVSLEDELKGGRKKCSKKQ